MKELVWSSTLDDVYECEVSRTGEYKGQLTVSKGGETLYTEDVTLSYGAKFGPDVDDVWAWQESCVKFIDGRNTEG